MANIVPASVKVRAMRLVLPIRIAQLAAAIVAAAVLCGCASGPRSRIGSAADSRARERRPTARAPTFPATSPAGPMPSRGSSRSGPAAPTSPTRCSAATYVPLTRDLPFSERGLASWYGRKFHGRMTSSGEPYDMYAMTAAHPTLPIPSYVRIRNPANGREVVVRVNDRGPFVSGRIVDLSYAAAFKLDLLRGVAPVELERITFDDDPHRCLARRRAARRRGAAGGRAVAAGIGGGEARPAAAEPAVRCVVPDGSRRRSSAAHAVRRADAAAAPPASETSSPRRSDPPKPARRERAGRGFWIQLGAFRERDGAERFRRRVATDSESAWLEPLLAVFGDALLYRVQAGPYASREEAEGAAQRARAALGLVPVVVERR